MAYVVAQRIAETSTTTGTGAFALAAAVTGYRRFNAVCVISDTAHYVIVADDGTWEAGIGTYSSANTLTRTTVEESSNANLAVTFAAGAKQVFLAFPGAARAYAAAASKATPVDADYMPLADTAASNTLAKLTWANLKATLKTYFDSLTTTLTNKSFDAINTGQLAGLRSKIMNGGMDVAQRGTSFAAAANVYTLDRWFYGASSAAVVTVSQAADAPASNEFQNSLRVTVTTADASIAAGDTNYLMQPIEGYNVRDLIGKTFTVSFAVRSAKTGIHCLTLRNGAGDRSYVVEYTVSVANTWENKTITVVGGLITAGTWNWTTSSGLSVGFAMASGSTYQTTAGAWNTGNFLSTANQVNVMDTIGNIFAITGVQLEIGAVATAFEHRPYVVELGLCLRYYFNLGTMWLTGYTVDAASQLPMSSAFPQPMRTSPSCSYGTASPTNIGSTSTNITATSFGFSAVTTAAGWYRVQLTGITYSAEL